MAKKIGLSLSLCVNDIISGKVEEKDVKEIIANTDCRNARETKEVLSLY